MALRIPGTPVSPTALTEGKANSVILTEGKSPEIPPVSALATPLPPSSSAESLQRRAEAFGEAASHLTSPHAANLNRPSGDHSETAATNLRDLILQSKSAQEATDLFQRVKALKDHVVVARLLAHPLSEEIFANKAKFATLDDIVEVIGARYGEYELGFFEKTKLWWSASFLKGELPFFQSTSNRFGNLTGLPEGTSALEILSTLVETRHASPESRRFFNRVLELLAQASQEK